MADHFGTRARVAAVLAVLVAAACGSGDPPEIAAESTADDAVALVDLEPGDCFVDLDATTGTRSSATTVTRVACEKPHDHEVFHAFAYGENEPYPGETDVVMLAEAGCLEAFVGGVGNPDALDQISIWPTTESWAQGDRTVLCAAFARDGDQLVGSIR